jgi:hypothetical protein
MFENSKHVIKISQNPDNWILAIVFFIPAFFLTLKGTATTALFLLFFICASQIIRSPRYYFVNRAPQFWIVVLFLLSPFVSELSAQIGRGDLVLSSLDGPSRAILATVVFIYLSKKECEILLSALTLGSVVGISLVFCYLQIFPEHYWLHRAATHFVDPITLPCYTVGLLGMVLFGDVLNLRSEKLNCLKLLMCVLTIYIAIESYSRSAWVAGVVLAIVYVLYLLRASFLKQTLGICALVFSMLAVFHLSDVVSHRAQEAYLELIEFVEGGEGRYSSTGHRIKLMLIDFKLIKTNLFFGVGDGVMPSYESLKSAVPSLNKEVYEIKTLAGSHSEFLAQLVSKGIFFGSYVIWGLFGYPLYLVIRELWRKKSLDPELEKLVGFIIPVLTSGLTIQVLNLKMTISFYILFLAIFLAMHHQKNWPSRLESE